MPVTFKTATKAKTKKAPTKAKSSISKVLERTKELVDIIVMAQKPIQAAKEPAKEQTKSKKELLELIEGEYSSNEEIVVKGTLGAVKFSAPSTKTSIADNKALHKKLGDDTFYAICNPSITQVKAYLTPVEQQKFLEESEGSRSMSVIPD